MIQTSRVFSNILDTFDLKQHVYGPTHKYGHTLDLIITRTNEDIITDYQIGDAISDHNAIISYLRIKQPIIQKNLLHIEK